MASSAKHVASCADSRAGLMIALVDVAGAGASRSVFPRWLVGRYVATRARGVARGRVKGRQRGRRVAGLARGWSRETARAVRAMARAATPLDRRVRLAGHLRVAGGARGRGLPGVRLVAAQAELVARRRGLLLGNVARAASHRRRDRVHDRRAVARRAVGMTWVRGYERGLASMAVSAHGFRVESGEGVRLVARLAGDTSRMSARVQGSHLRVAARASDGDDGRIVAVGRVACDARPRAAVCDLDVLVAPQTRGRCAAE